jgi:hypothetical protein
MILYFHCYKERLLQDVGYHLQVAFKDYNQVEIIRDY